MAEKGVRVRTSVSHREKGKEEEGKHEISKLGKNLKCAYLKQGVCICKNSWMGARGVRLVVNAGKDEVKGSEVNLTEWKGLVFTVEY